MPLDELAVLATAGVFSLSLALRGDKTDPEVPAAAVAAAAAAAPRTLALLVTD